MSSEPGARVSDERLADHLEHGYRIPDARVDEALRELIDARAKLAAWLPVVRAALDVQPWDAGDGALQRVVAEVNALQPEHRPTETT